MEGVREGSSFRDPSGFVFRRDETLYRQVNERYRSDYDLLKGSGLYQELVEEGLLVPHQEVSLELAASPGAYRVLQPERIPFVSYPYEWSFGQLKAAALLTLEIQRRALEHGLCLKDASAFNVQFAGTRPVFIDTLSFEAYRDGEPWVAYAQFCRHFLAPLQLMSRVDVRLGKLSGTFLDGVPLDLASRLLPRRSWLSFQSLLHLHLHARSIRRFANAEVAEGPGASRRSVSRRGLEGLLESLESSVRKASWNPEDTEWADYEETHAYAEEAFHAKQHLVSRFLDQLAAREVWDLGANTGAFSRLAAERAELVIALDSDPGAVEKHFRRLEDGESGAVLPLCVDLTNPSAGLGWRGVERRSLADRGPADAALALALVHHLAISGNLPFDTMARGFASLARDLIVEFVPKEDPQARRLLRSREDVFDAYTKNEFEEAFSRTYTIEEREPLPGSERALYLMRARSGPARG